ncbi:MAG: type I DNA topoisomerase [Gemmatimonadetes bacterium]|nr:type I DNA topoisomerase [Gemmatimonadota bacterium]
MGKGSVSRLKHLVIVESPAKARTIGRYLGPGFDVAASVGHVRDLPTKELGVDVENGFEPHYVTIRGKAKILSELKRKAKDVDMVILATDPDREGEAIAFHVAAHLGFEEHPERFQRVEFREITKSAVEKALQSPGALDMKKVEAQQARRVLDRLVGYQVSPFLWKPIRPGLSAGRVQTVALRLICEREDEIRAFQTEEYWSITAHLEKDGQPFEARLHQIEGRAFTLGNEAASTAVVTDIAGVVFQASEVKRRERRKNPAPPFTTSTLQQEAAKRLRFSARQTMAAAQRLYEGVELGSRGAVGLITYMRTDSTRVSAEAAQAARRWVEKQIGAAYVPSAPQLWTGKQQKGAQEAHEAIRPSDPTLLPEEVRGHVEESDARLYELIWLRFVASQMASTIYDTTTADFDLSGKSERGYRFRSTGSVVKFDGFTRLYREATEQGEHRRLEDLDPLPDLQQGDRPSLTRVEPKQHFTQPLPRFSEASLVRELEKRGIGRPSTYAQILTTIRDRGYVDMEERRFFPTPLGDTVAKLLVRVFPDLFDPAFTSRMEGELDRVEDGQVPWKTVLEEFYPPFRKRLEEGKASSEEIVKEILAAEGETCEKCGSPMIVKWNRFGRFLGCSAYPECKSTRSLNGAGEKSEDRVLGPDPKTGLPVLVRVGPYGPYVQLGEKGADAERPRRVSLPAGVEPGAVPMDLALKLLSLPRTLGLDPETGKPVTAGLGRYGPYVERARTYRNLKQAEDVFTVTLEEAIALLATKGGPAVVKALGPHPVTGVDLNVLAGRYGPYVTDGKVNASLPKGAEPEAFTLEEAVELLETAGKKPGSGRGRGGRSGAGGSRAAGAKVKRGARAKKGRVKKGSEEEAEAEEGG